ncbi:Crp/Fnr family transcriptional regulator [Aurantibacter crassamenti]|uniref:Crp/Fnr family transcriptional regulator n=1 Tax=Aurantibacter crassamenti TaxID=1837375 RepID=UPI001939BECD|nr:Crp/Fnr family transcriptional regulator [Aurantibacter crassamenti]MBM1104507.1 Crp/Fnr family transcriptional regulator [Aurantibacter crassamenti]
MKKFLINTFNISESEAQLFSDSFERINLIKGERFITYGKVCNRVGFVEKGILKCTLISSEKSVVDDFAFENQFVANYYSFLRQEKSNKEIVCLQDSVLRIITRNKLEELSKYTFIANIARQVSEQLFISTSKKLEDIRLLSAEERYLRLVKINKRITDEIPQYEIASYLNVSPETVSRIRKKIARGS